MYKINRNFMMQLVINSCKKMQVYHVDDSQDWNIVLDTYREHLLNEEFTVSTNIRDLLGKGAVLSFKKIPLIAFDFTQWQDARHDQILDHMGIFVFAMLALLANAHCMVEHARIFCF